MLEILVAAAAMLAMARKPAKRRRRMGRYLRGSVELDFDLGALATKDLIAGPFAGVVEERTFVSSVVATWAIKDLAIVADDGPIIVGIAHGDYTAVEIEEFLENSGSWTEGNLVQQEVAKRKVRVVGTFRAVAAAAEATQTYVLNEGRPIRTKCGWILTTGQTIDAWAYNAGSDAITTGSKVSVYGHANLWPR